MLGDALDSETNQADVVPAQQHRMQVARPKAHARQPLLERLDTLFRVAPEVLDARESLFFVIRQEPHAVALGDFDERARRCYDRRSPIRRDRPFLRGPAGHAAIPCARGQKGCLARARDFERIEAWRQVSPLRKPVFPARGVPDRICRRSSTWQP